MASSYSRISKEMEGVARYCALAGVDTPGKHAARITETFMRNLMAAALAGKRLELVIREERVLERLAEKSEA